MLKTGGQKISLSTSSIIKVFVVIGCIYLLYLTSDIIILLFASIILAAAIDPMVHFLEKWKIPRSLCILLIYLALLAVVGLTVYLIIPPIVSESKDLASNLPTYLNNASDWFFDLKRYSENHNLPFDLSNVLNQLATGLQSATSTIMTALSSLFGGLFSLFLILVITFYMTMEESSLKKAVGLFVPAKNQTHALKLISQIQEKIGLWFRGQLLLCFIIFLLTYMSLSIFGVKYALVLALIAGLTEAVPYLGPTLAAIPAVFMAFIQSPLLAVFILFVYIIIQAVENNILVPKVMQKAVGLNPIVSIISLMVGFQLGGVLGAFLAIPVATTIAVVIKDLYLNKNFKSQNS